VFCPFVSLKSGDAVERLRLEPEQVAESLMLEYTSLCFNHRSTLYRDRSLMSVLRADNNQPAIDAFHTLREKTPLGLYRVRRIMTSKGHGHRCTERLTWVLKRSPQVSDLDAIISDRNLTAITYHAGDYDIRVGLAIDRELGSYPQREEFLVCAPATVGARARYGLPWFDAKWNAANQTELFK
jgi:hypothetical protein